MLILRAPLRAAARLLPGLCVVCRDWCKRGLCEPCLQRFAPARARCAGCARASAVAVARCGQCLNLASAYSRCITGTDYAPPWDRLITDFKFHQQPELAGALSWLLQRSLAAATHVPVNDGPALLVPVPLSRQRLRERGYNQAWELARRLGRQLGAGADAGVLRRSRDTAHQIGMSRSEREHNLRDAFWVEPSRIARLRDRAVALIDDVLTTGATAHAAALVLKRAGAAQVDVWVVARTA